MLGVGVGSSRPRTEMGLPWLFPRSCCSWRSRRRASSACWRSGPAWAAATGSSASPRWRRCSRLALLIPAYELVVVFTVQCLVIVPTLLVARRLRTRSEGKPASQFTIRDLLLATAVVAAVLAVGANVPREVWTSWDFLGVVPPFLQLSRLAALGGLPVHRADRRLRDARRRRTGLGSLATMATGVACCCCLRCRLSWRPGSWCTRLSTSEPSTWFRGVLSWNAGSWSRRGGRGCPASRWVCCFLRSRWSCGSCCFARRFKTEMRRPQRATTASPSAAGPSRRRLVGAAWRRAACAADRGRTTS